MRPLLVVILSTFCLGIVWGYATFAEWLKPSTPEYATERAEGNFSVRIQLSFDQAKNDSLGESAENEFLMVKLNGTTIKNVDTPILSTEETVIDKLDVVVGENRIFVSAKSVAITDEQRQKNAEAFLLDESPADPPSILCVRVQIFRDGVRVNGADFTSHADGQEFIILDEQFNVVSNDSHEHQH